MNIGKTIRELRIKKGVKQQDMAYELGVTPTYLSLIEHGRARPSIDMIAIMAKYFSLSPGELVVLSMGDKLDEREDIKNAVKIVIDPLVKYLTT